MEVHWRALGPDDLPVVAALAGRCLAADGGLPTASTPQFLGPRFTTDESLAAFAGADLVAAAGTRPALGRALAMVDPDRRGHGLGARLLDWSLERATTIETEGLSPDAEKLFASRGLTCAFAEDIMSFDLAATPPPAVQRPDGVTFTDWEPGLAARFFAAYESSFRDRPGFPGWSKEEWLEDFHPQWTLLASTADGDAGFITGAEGWIVQVGVAPASRRQGLGAALIAEVLRRMHAHDQPRTLLDVNVDNRGAAALYKKLGFKVIGRRAQFRDPGMFRGS